jgi:hypothetical protein
MERIFGRGLDSDSNIQRTGKWNRSFEVPASTAPPRSATITIAGQKFSVTQSEGCAYTIAPPSQSVPAAGGNGAIAITTTLTGPWTASCNVTWLTREPGSGAWSGVCRVCGRRDDRTVANRHCGGGRAVIRRDPIAGLLVRRSALERADRICRWHAADHGERERGV